MRAEPLYRKALAIRETLLGKEHPDYAESLTNLGMFYNRQGSYSRAEPMLLQALEIRKHPRGEP